MNAHPSLSWLTGHVETSGLTKALFGSVAAILFFRKNVGMNAMPRLDILRARSELLRRTRDFFYQKDFLEVQTPTLSADTMVDKHIDPIEVTASGVSKQLYLQTSPEFSMKRLLLEGAERIFELTPAFRNGEVGQLHNPEFTMLEWYRVGDRYEQGRQLLADFATMVFPNRPVRQTAYADLFQSYLGFNPHKENIEKARAICQNHQLEIPEGRLTVTDILEILMSEIIEQELGKDEITIVYDWPAEQSALACLARRSDNSIVAERFELYVDGIELANGYHELRDPAEQLQRLSVNNQFRINNGQSSLPVESKLLEFMRERNLPGCCGVAVGFDRLLQVQLGLTSVTDAMTYAIDKA